MLEINVVKQKYTPQIQNFIYNLGGNTQYKFRRKFKFTLLVQKFYGKFKIDAPKLGR